LLIQYYFSVACLNQMKGFTIYKMGILSMFSKILDRLYRRDKITIATNNNTSVKSVSIP